MTASPQKATRWSGLNFGRSPPQSIANKLEPFASQFQVCRLQECLSRQSAAKKKIFAQFQPYQAPIARSFLSRAHIDFDVADATPTEPSWPHSLAPGLHRRQPSPTAIPITVRAGHSEIIPRPTHVKNPGRNPDLVMTLLSGSMVAWWKGTLMELTHLSQHCWGGRHLSVPAMQHRHTMPTAHTPGADWQPRPCNPWTQQRPPKRDRTFSQAANLRCRL